MNQIQQISREIETRRLKRQLGIDSGADIDPSAIHQMWHARRQRELNHRLSRQYRDGEFGALPQDPDFLRED